MGSQITRRDLKRREAFNGAIATMFAGDENKPLRRALRKCHSVDAIREIPGIPPEKAEAFIHLFWPHLAKITRPYFSG